MIVDHRTYVIASDGDIQEGVGSEVCSLAGHLGLGKLTVFYDNRTYELQPGRLRDFLALYEKEGLPVQKKHLGNLVGFFTTEVGNVNEIVHIWGYEDLADRTRRRAAMAADPAWQAYLQKSREYMKHMINTILVPTSFSPTK